MNRKSTYLLLFILSLTGFSFAQPISGSQTVNNYTIAQKRLLVVSTANFINYISQNSMDPDSVMSMAGSITNLPFLLPYTEIFDDKRTLSTELINAGKIAEAKQLLNSVHGETKIQLLIELAIWYLHQTGNNKTDLDSANQYIQLASNHSIPGNSGKLHNECQILAGELKFQVGDIAQSKQIYLNLLSSAGKEGDFHAMAGASQRLGFLINNNDSLKLYYFNKALVLCQQLQLKEKKTALLWDIANCCPGMALALRKEYLVEGLALQKATGFKHVMYSEYMISYMNLLFGNYLEAINTAKDALENIKLAGFVEVEPTFFMRVGVSFQGIGKNEEALIWYRKAIACRYTSSHIFWYKSFVFATELLVNLDRNKEALALIDTISKQFPPVTKWQKMQILTLKGICYEHLNNYKLTDENYVSFYNLYIRYPEADPFKEFSSSIMHIALYYISQTELKKANLFLHLALTHSFHHKDIYTFTQKYLAMYKIDSINGNYKMALQHLLKYKIYYDSMVNMNQRQKLDELTVKYAVDKKDQDIKFFKQKGNAQQAELKQNRLTQKITIAGIVLLLIVIALLFNQYRVKQRTNTAINKKNTALEKLVNEKEWLLKEIHHRVKNNLQTVVSLLELQSHFLDNEALSANHDSQNRIYAMSLIHQKLYPSDNIASINMCYYLQELSGHLREIYNTGSQINFKLQVPEIELDVSQAIPIGLIVNEVVTNCIKYAFNLESKNPVITISLEKNNKDQLMLTIEDNGIGLPVNFNTTDKAGLGFKLMEGLVEDIDGELTIESVNGTQISVCFNASVPFHEANPVLITEKTTSA
ncbi:MAG: sensor histidine kinase [Ferruginibacter sp.]